MFESMLWCWFQERAIDQERALAGAILDLAEDTIIYSDLRLLQDMLSRFIAPQVGQLLTSHFPRVKHLYRFHYMPAPLYECYNVVDTRDH